LRCLPKAKIDGLEAQTHRRYLKTHLPVDALVFSPKAKYLYIARDGRDVLWSLHNHHFMANEVWYKALNETPGLVGPPIGKPTEDIVQYYHEWLDKDGFPFWPFWDNIRTWWQIRHLPNVKLLHFQALKDDMKGQIREIAAFLDIPIDENKWESIVEHCSFEYMKAHPEKLQKDSLWDGGNKTFFNKGTN